MEQFFEKINFITTPPTQQEYEYCIFTGCDFSGADLSGIRFIDCSFNSCNLSLAKLANTSFMDIQFINCKMLGLLFTDCSDFNFTVRFDGCVLDNASFYKKKMKKVVFKNTSLKEADLSACELNEAVFDHCDLTGTTFDQTLLEKADFRTAVNYTIDPERNRLKKAKFSIEGLPGLLGKYDIRIER